MDCNTYKIMLKNKTIEQFIKKEKPYGTYLENVVYRASKLRVLRFAHLLISKEVRADVLDNVSFSSAVLAEKSKDCTFTLLVK